MRAKSLFKHSIIFALLIAIVAIAIDAALATGLDDYYRVAVVQATKYCNCDEDCFENQGCLTEGAGWILTLPGDHQKFMDEAKTKGYSGVCAQLFFQGYEIPYTMTKNCTAQPAIPETDIVNATSLESNASESNLTSLSPSPANATAENVLANLTTNQTANASSESASQQEPNITVSTAASEQPAEEEEPKEDLKKEDDVKEEQIQEGLAQEQTQEEGKMVPTVYIIAGTTIIMGFFVLIGWLAYLLYRK